MSYRFDPDWVIAPGATLQEWLDETHLPARSVARLAGIDLPTLDRLLAGDLEIDETLAYGLERATGASARLWLALEHNYRVGLAAGKKDITRD